VEVLPNFSGVHIIPTCLGYWKWNYSIWCLPFCDSVLPWSHPSFLCPYSTFLVWEYLLCATVSWEYVTCF
jgi:hypothetical protein